MTPIQLLGMAFPDLDFRGYVVDRKHWIRNRHAFYIVRTAYMNMGENSPDSGWYCIELDDDGNVRTFRMSGGYERRAVRLYTEKEDTAKEWIQQ